MNIKETVNLYGIHKTGWKNFQLMMGLTDSNVQILAAQDTFKDLEEEAEKSRSVIREGMIKSLRMNIQLSDDFNKAVARLEVYRDMHKHL